MIGKYSRWQGALISVMVPTMRIALLLESYTAHMGLGEAVQHSSATHFLYPLMLRSLAMDLFFPMGMRATEGGRLPEI
jgi:hypothetical protein